MCKRNGFYQHWNRHHAAKHAKYGEHPAKAMWKEKFGKNFNRPPVNVQELDDKYELHLYAPGLEKNDFVISITDSVLSISAEKKNEETSQWKRQEFLPGGFERKFELNEKVDKEAIAAKYEAGVLVVSLPKLEGFETLRQEVTID